MRIHLKAFQLIGASTPINGFLVGITSADVPGATSRYVEQQFGDTTVVIWAQGALGDQNPLYTRPATNALASVSGVKITGYQRVRESVEGPLREGKVPRGTLDPKVADTLERWMESQGQLLGEEVIRVMTNKAGAATRRLPCFPSPFPRATWRLSAPAGSSPGPTARSWTPHSR